MQKTIEYIVMVDNSQDSRYKTLKAARDYVRSMLNICEVRQTKVKIDIFSETVIMKHLSTSICEGSTVGKLENLF